MIEIFGASATRMGSAARTASLPVRDSPPLTPETHHQAPIVIPFVRDLIYMILP